MAPRPNIVSTLDGITVQWNMTHGNEFGLWQKEAQSRVVVPNSGQTLISPLLSSSFVSLTRSKNFRFLFCLTQCKKISPTKEEQSREKVLDFSCWNQQ